MNVRLIGGPANGQILAVEDGIREVVVPALARDAAVWDFAPSPEDYPPAFRYHRYRPSGQIGESEEVHVVPFYLNGERPNG